MKRFDPTLSRRRSLVAIAALAGGALAPLHAAGLPLRLGLVPYLSPTVLLSAFRAVREHLERSLDRPIEMLTAKDFRSLVEATARNEYDVLLLPAHLARLAMIDWHYEPLAGTIEVAHVLVLVKGAGSIRTAADLKGERAGMLDALSLTASVGIQWLQDEGLTADVKVQPMPSLNSAMFALDSGEVAMVVATTTQLLMLPASTPRQERVLATIRNIPGPIYVARPGLPAEELARIRAALTSFRPDPAQPTTVPNSVLRSVSAAELVALEPFVVGARKALAAAR